MKLNLGHEKHIASLSYGFVEQNTFEEEIKLCNLSWQNTTIMLQDLPA